jgi:hypothetical protein
MILLKMPETDFNPIRAASEQLQGVEQALKAIRTQRRAAEQALSEAEAYHNALKLIEAMTKEIADQKREALERAQDAAQDK